MSTVYYNGPYDPSRGYGPGALVQFGGHTYICTAPIAACHKYSEDDFTGRTVRGGWGRASDGHSLWTTGADNNQSYLQNFSVQNGRGLLTYSGSGALLNDGMGGGFWLMFGAIQSGAERDLLLRYRYTQAMDPGWLIEWTLNSDPAWNLAAPDVEIATPHTTHIWVYNGGTDSTGASTAGDLGPGTWYDTRLRCASPLFAARTWPAGTAEPETWDVALSDAFTVTPGQALFDARWAGMPAHQQLQFSRVAILGQNPTPDVDSRFDQIA